MLTTAACLLCSFLVALRAVHEGRNLRSGVAIIVCGCVSTSDNDERHRKRVCAMPPTHARAYLHASVGLSVAALATRARGLTRGRRYPGGRDGAGEDDPGDRAAVVRDGNQGRPGPFHDHCAALDHYQLGARVPALGSLARRRCLQGQQGRTKVHASLHAHVAQMAAPARTRTALHTNLRQDSTALVGF